MKLARSARPTLARRARLRWDAHTSQQMLLYPERGIFLNPTGTAILRLCDGVHTIDAIVVELTVRFASSPAARIATDVLAFLEAMNRRNLLKVAP